MSMAQHTVLVYTYRKSSSISLTKSQHLNVPRLVLQLLLPGLLKAGVKSGMKMYLEHQRQLQLHLSDQQIYCLLKCAVNLTLIMPIYVWTYYRLMSHEKCRECVLMIWNKYWGILLKSINVAPLGKQDGLSTYDYMQNIRQTIRCYHVTIFHYNS